MSYYMITYGSTSIEEAYVGQTEDDVVEKARSLINQWPEYARLENEEIIEHLQADEAEFDIVKIETEWQGYKIDLKEMINLYNNHSIPPHIYAN